VWRKVTETGCDYFGPRNLSPDPLENTFRAVHLHCGSNVNRTVGQSADALRASIITSLAFRGLIGTNRKDDGAALLDDAQGIWRLSVSSIPSHGREYPDNIPDSFHTVGQVRVEQEASAVHPGDAEVLSVTYDSGVSKAMVFFTTATATTTTTTTTKTLSQKW
jgi:hypothetical protein